VERVINELFEGHTLNYLECVAVDYKSSRRESFMDLQLDVKGCSDIYDSFDRCGACVRLVPVMSDWAVLT
jgi:ubiquitin carboxyl-terminal hydrolase 7